MATAIAHPESARPIVHSIPGRRFDHIFFTSMALLMLATVFAGFARTYYLAGVFHAPLPSLTIHMHAVAFSCWILLLVTQTSLVASGRVDIHRRLGIAGFLLACVMVVLGVLAATDSLVRGLRPFGRDPRAFYIIPLANMVIFAPLIFLAFRARFNPPAHKRLILIATVSLMLAAITRWPLALVHRHHLQASLASYVFLLLLVAYDLWSTRKVHRVTLWAGAFLVLVQQLAVPIGHTAAWVAFAGWVQRVSS